MTDRKRVEDLPTRERVEEIRRHDTSCVTGEIEPYSKLQLLQYIDALRTKLREAHRERGLTHAGHGAQYGACECEECERKGEG